jgi:crossover junction endodeoxyribonuclease RuvC
MVKMMLSLPEIAFEDASDALAIAICHCNTSGLKDKIEKALK